MNREIKFRVWNKISKEYTYFDTLELTLLPKGQPQIAFKNVSDTKRMISGYEDEEQYTGLKDKNGKRDLYEGDRVVIGNERGVLVWDEYDICWAIQLDSDDSYQSICRYYTGEEINNTEYLGNIHDNPELINSN